MKPKDKGLVVLKTKQIWQSDAKGIINPIGLYCFSRVMPREILRKVHIMRKAKALQQRPVLVVQLVQLAKHQHFG